MSDQRVIGAAGRTAMPIIFITGSTNSRERRNAEISFARSGAQSTPTHSIAPKSPERERKLTAANIHYHIIASSTPRPLLCLRPRPGVLYHKYVWRLRCKGVA